MSRPLALVTGASSGIGTDFALELAHRGYDLLLTGRDAPRLEAAAARVREAGVQTDQLLLDLGGADAVKALVAWVGDRPLAVLVNNAGFGTSGPVADADPTVLEALIQLNITALTLLTQALVPGMVRRGQGRVLNVASTAAFSPIPAMAVYAASKAYVLSFSDALAEELRGTGVTVTAVCPGPTSTRFADRAALGSSALFRSAMSSETVAEIGLKALFRGRPVRVAGALNAALAFSSRLAPRILLASAAGRLMGSARK